MSQLYDEAQACINDHANWSPQHYRLLIKQLAERIKELEPKARIYDSWQANSKEVA